MTAEPAHLSYAEFRTRRHPRRAGRRASTTFPEARKPAYKLRIDFGGEHRRQEVVSAGHEALLEGGAAEPPRRRRRELSAEADRPVHVGGADARRARRGGRRRAAGAGARRAARRADVLERPRAVPAAAASRGRILHERERSVSAIAIDDEEHHDVVEADPSRASRMTPLAVGRGERGLERRSGGCGRRSA